MRRGKMPQSRDGHTGLMHEGNLIIFGGDRHHFTFCDTFVFDLDLAMRAKGLDVPNE